MGGGVFFATPEKGKNLLDKEKQIPYFDSVLYTVYRK